MTIRIEDVQSLPVPDRIKLVAEIWDGIAASPEQIEITPETIELLEQRLKAHRRNPQDALPWDDVKDRILKTQE